MLEAKIRQRLQQKPLLIMTHIVIGYPSFRESWALARAMVVRPAVLLLDEPLGALDKMLREEMQVELRQLQQRLGITAVFVTHDQEEALTLSDHVAVMRGGEWFDPGSEVGRPLDELGLPGVSVDDWFGERHGGHGAAGADCCLVLKMDSTWRTTARPWSHAGVRAVLPRRTGQ